MHWRCCCAAYVPQCEEECNLGQGDCCGLIGGFTSILCGCCSADSASCGLHRRYGGAHGAVELSPRVLRLRGRHVQQIHREQIARWPRRSGGCAVQVSLPAFLLLSATSRGSPIRFIVRRLQRPTGRRRARCEVCVPGRLPRHLDVRVCDRGDRPPRPLGQDADALHRPHLGVPQPHAEAGAVSRERQAAVHWNEWQRHLCHAIRRPVRRCWEVAKSHRVCVLTNELLSFALDREWSWPSGREIRLMTWLPAGGGELVMHLGLADIAFHDHDDDTYTIYALFGFVRHRFSNGTYYDVNKHVLLSWESPSLQDEALLNTTVLRRTLIFIVHRPHFSHAKFRRVAVRKNSSRADRGRDLRHPVGQQRHGRARRRQPHHGQQVEWSRTSTFFCRSR